MPQWNESTSLPGVKFSHELWMRWLHASGRRSLPEAGSKCTVIAWCSPPRLMPDRQHMNTGGGKRRQQSLSIRIAQPGWDMSVRRSGPARPAIGRPGPAPLRFICCTGGALKVAVPP
eukprot:3188269-Prymnesium_polylepis.1